MKSIKYNNESKVFSIIEKTFAKKNNSNSNNNQQNNNKNKNNKNNPPADKNTGKKTLFETILLKRLNSMQDQGLVLSYKKVSNEYAVEVSSNRAVIIYITNNGDYILSKLNSDTGGYIGADNPTKPNAIICGPNNLEEAMNTMLYTVSDKESMMQKLWRKYFT